MDPCTLSQMTISVESAFSNNIGQVGPSTALFCNLPSINITCNFSPVTYQFHLSTQTSHLSLANLHLLGVTSFLSPVPFHLSLVNYNLSSVAFHLSYITFPLSPVTCHLSPVTYHRSPVTSRQSFVNCHLSPFSCLWSLVTCNLSPVTSPLTPFPCHLSPSTVTCYLSLVTWPGSLAVASCVSELHQNSPCLNMFQVVLCILAMI